MALDIILAQLHLTRMESPMLFDLKKDGKVCGNNNGKTVDWASDSGK